MEQAPVVSVPSHKFELNRVLTVRERDSINTALSLNARIAEATSESYQLATNGGAPVLPPGFNVNKARLNEQAKINLAILKNQSPRDLSTVEKDTLMKRKNELEAKIKASQCLETFKELHANKRGSEWTSAMKKANMRPKWEKDIQELKNIRISLEPENPEAQNLDDLRREKD